MLVSLRPETPEDATYQIQIHQKDIDGDIVIYTAPIAVTGQREGTTPRDFKKEVYFIPKATAEPGFDFGLPNPNDALRPLNEQLKVFVATESGRQIAQLPIENTITSIDPRREPHMIQRGVKLILAVSDPDTGSQPVWNELQPQAGTLGIKEDVIMVSVRPRELPESILGYEAVDGVLFLNADPNELRTPTDERMRALRQYVREGGTLVICQPPQWEKTLGFTDLLPVFIPRPGTPPGGQVIANRNEPTPLIDWVMEGMPSLSDQSLNNQRRQLMQQNWSRARPPFRIALAEPKPEAYVAEWIEWEQEEGQTEKSPYVVRQVVGLGTVTWVAQDLGDPSLTRVKEGWPYIWKRVFGWNDQPYLPDPGNRDRNEIARRQYDSASGVDVGPALLTGMEHGERGAGLVLLVVFFFIAYWVIAGPVSFVVLAARKQSHLSWFAFGAAAIVATALTAGVVELVLRGDPQVKHVSVVRLTQSDPAVIHSRIGLYIPDDGRQEIELQDTAAGALSYITPYSMHPQHIDRQVAFTAVLTYEVPVPDVARIESPRIYIPFRSTLKKIEAKWIGYTRSQITGQVKLREGSNLGRCALEGQLTNNTPHTLRHVYLAFMDAMGNDALCYIPSWESGQTIDLQADFPQWHVVGRQLQRMAVPGQGQPIADLLQSRSGAPLGWTAEYLFDGMTASFSNYTLDDSGDGYRRSMVLLSLYDRLIPTRADERRGRSEILRRDARELDMSNVVAAGQLAIVAVAQSVPLPMPLHVEGEAVAGEGDIIYQAVVPIDRSVLSAQATTQPAEEDQSGQYEVE